MGTHSQVGFSFGIQRLSNASGEAGKGLYLPANQRALFALLERLQGIVEGGGDRASRAKYQSANRHLIFGISLKLDLSRFSS